MKIHCQIGSDYAFESGDTWRKPYAERYGFDTDAYSRGCSLEELEAGVKIMRKIERKLAKMSDSLGYTTTYAEFCQRILLASGVKWLISEPNGGWAVGGRMSEKLLTTVSSGSARRLAEMERELISRFSAKAA